MKNKPVLLIVQCLLLTFLTISCSKKVTNVQEPAKSSNQPITDQSNLKKENPVNEDDLERKIKEIFEPVYFDYDRSEIMQSEKYKLEKIASFLNENRSIKVRVEGHCDERGSSEYNIGLGENRAKTVQQFLSAYGIPSSRIDITSLGKEDPVNANCMDDFCHSKNRRGEWKIIQR